MRSAGKSKLSWCADSRLWDKSLKCTAFPSCAMPCNRTRATRRFIKMFLISFEFAFFPFHIFWIQLLWLFYGIFALCRARRLIFAISALLMIVICKCNTKTACKSDCFSVDPLQRIIQSSSGRFISFPFSILPLMSLQWLWSWQKWQKSLINSKESQQLICQWTNPFISTSIWA